MLYNIRKTLFAAALCAAITSSAQAAVTFEFWDVVSYEAYARCESIPFSGNAQLSVDDQWPDGTGSIDLSAWAELGDELSSTESYAIAYSTVTGDTYYAPALDSYMVTIENEGYAYADIRDGNTQSISAEVEAYFLLAIYVPVGETYKCTADYLEMQADITGDVDFDESAWHLTFGGGPAGFSTSNGSLTEGTSITLTGQEGAYLFYGGFKFSASDESLAASDNNCWAHQMVDLQLTAIPEPATITLLVLGAAIITARHKK